MQRVRVLVAEDESIVAEDIREQLTKMGTTVVGPVASGEQAVQVAGDSHPDIVLMDIRLKGRLDGVEAAEEIRRRFHIPVVFLTAHSDDATLERAKKTQPQGYLLKPFEESDLRVNIELALSKHLLECRLRESEQRYATTLSSIGDAVIATDVQGRITFMNNVAEQLTRWRSDDVIGAPLGQVFRIVNEDSRDTTACPLTKALKDGLPTDLENHTLLITKDGQEVPIDDCAAPIFDHNKKVQGGVLVFRDVTEKRAADDAQRKSQEQLHWLQRLEAIGRLAGGMAHEINNMLTVVLGCGELLISQVGKDHAMRATLETMLGAGDRTATLTRQLLAFSRKQLLSPSLVNMNKVLQRMHPMFARLLRGDIELEMRLDRDLPAVLVDPMQWEQVLVNLALNARDAMPRGGNLVFETRKVVLDDDFAASHPTVSAGPYVMLAAKDDGCGMDEATQAHLFEPFFTTKQLGKGTGLGLATVYGIVTQSGGHIFVESRLGQGTTFSIYLPVAAAVAAPAPQTDVINASLPRGKETVLLVEDEESVRSYVSQVLRDLGYTVLEAEHGEHALQVAERHQGSIDLLLTDVMMPRIGGPELSRTLRATRPELKVVYMSGYVDLKNAPEQLPSEGLVLLQKPFTASALACKVRAQLDG
jgi:two-component system cell cycle sensor histidine kinase/response regulator CckA